MTNSILLERCLRAGTWEHSVSTFRQLGGIGLSYIRVLALNGIKGFSQLRQVKPETLELWCHRSTPFGHDVLDDLNRIPHYSLSVGEISEALPDRKGPVHVQLVAKITLLNAAVKPVGKRVKPASWTTFVAIANGSLLQYERFLYNHFSFPYNKNR